jgi:hypothetical protein
VRKNLADIVVAEGLVDEQRVSSAEKYARRSGEPLIVALVELERVGEIALVAALGRHLRLPLVELSVEQAEPDALREVPHELARRRRLLPLALEQKNEGPRILRLAMADPTDRDAIAEVEISTGCQVVPLLATLSSVDEAIGRAYRGIVTAIMRRGDEEETTERSPGTARRVPFGGNLAVATPALPELRAGTPQTGPTTEPFHHLEDEAPMELRHRALLELLQSKGLITLDEYWDEIRRLLKSRG